MYRQNALRQTIIAVPGAGEAVDREACSLREPGRGSGVGRENHVPTAVQHRLVSFGFLEAYVTTMRPYLLFVSGITGISGMALAASVPPARALLITLASFLSYGFGQALTDCFQIDTDRISSPYRPLTQGLIRRNQVLGVSLVGLGLCVTVLGLLHPWNLILGSIAGAGLATYTPFKRRWWGGPWYNAWIVGLLFMIGFLAGSGSGVRSTPAGLPWTLALVFFGYANFVLAGYFKDIEADRQSGYCTLPVRFGREISAVASDALAALTAISLISARLLIADPWSANFHTVVSWVFLLGALVASARAQILLHKVTRDDESHPAIALVVHAYILGLSALSAAAKPEWSIPLIAFWAGFLLTLRSRPSRSQV